jgi:hypothetical protein
MDRYRPGTKGHVDTPLPGFSMTRSMVNPLLGILDETGPDLAGAAGADTRRC